VAGGVCVAALATGRLDARDAAVAALLGEAAALLAECAGRCGDALVPYLRQSLLPALPLPPDLQACASRARRHPVLAPDAVLGRRSCRRPRALSKPTAAAPAPRTPASCASRRVPA
jgi:hypothetical protein